MPLKIATRPTTLQALPHASSKVFLGYWKTSLVNTTQNLCQIAAHITSCAVCIWAVALFTLTLSPWPYTKIYSVWIKLIKTDKSYCFANQVFDLRNSHHSRNLCANILSALQMSLKADLPQVQRELSVK